MEVRRRGGEGAELAGGEGRGATVTCMQSGSSPHQTPPTLSRLRYGQRGMPYFLQRRLRMVRPAAGGGGGGGRKERRGRLGGGAGKGGLGETAHAGQLPALSRTHPHPVAGRPSRWAAQGEGGGGFVRPLQLELEITVMVLQ